MSLGKHTLVNLAGWTVPMVVAIATVPHYITYIGQERFGVLAVIWTILSYFNFVDFGFGRAVTQRLARIAEPSPSEQSRLVWTGLLASIALAILGSAAVYAVATYLLSTQIKMSPDMRAEATMAARWVAIALPVVLPGSVLSGSLQARFRFVEANIAQSAGNVASQVIPLAVAASGHVELYWLIPAVLLARAATNVALYVQCRKHVPLLGPPILDTGLLRSMFAYGGWISAMNVVGPLLVAVDKLMIGTLTGARSVTHYAVPFDVVSRGSILSGSLSSALFPRIASVDEAKGHELAQDSVSVLVAVMTPIVILALVFFHPFLILWVGGDLAQASAGVGEIILIGLWFNSLAVPYYSRSLATGDAKGVASRYLLEVPMYLAALWFGIAHWGVVGAAAAWTFRIALDAVLLLLLNGALKATTLAVSPCFALIVFAFLLQFADLGAAQTISFAAAAVAAGLYINKRIYLRMVRNVIQPRASTP